jgi:TolB-like protein/DNA-binding winged helix-turn-helix (wHTH) protein
MVPQPTTARLIRFGIFEADLEAGEICKQGRKIHLQEQPFQVLAALLERPGQVVTRDELRRRLWPDHTFVDFDHGLNKAIKKIREALDDSVEHPLYIETLPKHGYRFIACIAAGAPRGRRWWPYFVLAGIGVTLGLAVVLDVGGLRNRLMAYAPGHHAGVALKVKSIAVLPLENLSPDPTQEYFADGMTDELITHLGKIGSLRVISRTSVVRYKRTVKPLPEIARDLGVDDVVEGTIQRSGDRLRINIQLLDARTDQHVWAQTYERSWGDFLAIQDEVTRDIADQIAAALRTRGG